MNLGAETILQFQSHNRGQTALGQDYASVSLKQMTCGFSYWDKMSIQQITFQKLKFKKYSQTHSSSLFGQHLVPLMPLAIVAVYVVTVM